MERLACFDRTYAQETEIIAERVEEKRQRTVADFGLSPKQINEREERESERAAQAVTSAPANNDSSSEAVAAAPAQQAEDGQITTTVTEVLTDALGNYVLILDNGQMWRSTSNKTFRGRIRTGWSVTIRKIWSGGFRMKIEDKRGFLGVVRIR